MDVKDQAINLLRRFIVTEIWSEEGGKSESQLAFHITRLPFSLIEMCDIIGSDDDDDDSSTRQMLSSSTLNTYQDGEENKLVYKGTNTKQQQKEKIILKSVNFVFVL